MSVFLHRLPTPLGAAALLILFGLSPLHAATLNVPADYPTIQAGIDAAAVGDTVLVADGTYTGTGNVDLDFGGKNITVQSVDGPHATIIDCGAIEAGYQQGYHRGFYLHSGETTAATISGFTIENGFIGNALDGTPQQNDQGGGIYVAHATVDNCIVSNNYAEYSLGDGPPQGNYEAGGGGIWAGNGSVLTNCIVTNNSSPVGGGIYAESNVTLTNCTVSGNSQTGVYAGSGSALTGCIITDNTTTVGLSCGGIKGIGITMTNCTVKDNTISPYLYVSVIESAGGVDVSDSTLNGCTISGNAIQRGENDNVGGIRAIDSVVIGCTVSNNSVAESTYFMPNFSCGGVYSDGSILTNCVVSGNTADVGSGGIWALLSTITNCTVAGNTNYSGDGGGGISASGSTLTNCILWYDQSGDASEIVDGGTDSLRVSYCDVQGGYSGVGNVAIVPRFDDPVSGDFAIGNSSSLPAGASDGAPWADINGTPRALQPGLGAYAYSSQQSYWSAASVSTGGDGFSRVLWNSTDLLYSPHTTSVWKVDASGNLVTQQQYGPFDGWRARAVATGPDNKTHLLWTNDGGAASLYLLDADSVFLSQQQYGPYTGWTARNIAVEADNTVRMLWTNADGTATFWHLSSNSQLIDQHQYGPYTGYTASSITSAPDGTGRVAWVADDDHIALWTIDSDNVYTGQTQFGPYSGWSYQGISVGSDGNSRLLWDNVSGQSALWSLTPGGAFATNNQYGTY
jgi:hypothetical protein